jgi:hypothetical protein
VRNFDLSIILGHEHVIVNSNVKDEGLEASGFSGGFKVRKDWRLGRL